jgi:uncharacterized zinc-type alcohol dehydrogenase-like protein
MATIKAWAAYEPGTVLKQFTYELSPLDAEEVEIEVLHCGLCHTDISFIKNELGFLQFPLVAGHEIVGKIVALGDISKRKGLTIGQVVGLGWMASSCGHCDPCLAGNQNLCKNGQPTIMGRHGGFADRVKAHWMWIIPIPEELNPADAGPLFCAGMTVFAPLAEYGVSPTQKIGIFGIGGLGHLAVQFSNAWGAEVTAFSSTASKLDEIKKMGADHIVSSRDTFEWDNLKGTFDLLIITVAVPLDWQKIIAMLAPKGRLHFVGIVFEPIPVSVLDLLIPNLSISASPGSTRTSVNNMLRFAARHGISPMVEHMPMSQINRAIERAESGTGGYRIVLDADFE